MGTKSIESENVVRGRRINFLGYCFTKDNVRMRKNMKKNFARKVKRIKSRKRNRDRFLRTWTGSTTGTPESIPRPGALAASAMTGCWPLHGMGPRFSTTGAWRWQRSTALRWRSSRPSRESRGRLWGMWNNPTQRTHKIFRREEKVLDNSPFLW